MNEASKTLTLVDLAKLVDSTPQAVWRVLAGETTDDVKMAMTIESRLNIPAKSLIFNTQDRMRPNVISWIAQYLGVERNTVWRYINAVVLPGPKIKKKLCDFADVGPLFWNKSYINNWMLTKGARQALSEKTTTL